MNDTILKTVSRAVIPLSIVYGSYIVIYGHLTPGGGFPGGAILGAAAILYTLVFGLERVSRKISHRVSVRLESGSLLLFIAVGLTGVVIGGAFLENLHAGFPAGEFASVLSGGTIPVLGVIIGIKVANTMIRLFHSMIEDDPE